MGVIEGEQTKVTTVAEIVAKASLAGVPLTTTRILVGQSEHSVDHHVLVTDSDHERKYTRTPLSIHKVLASLWHDIRQAEKADMDTTLMGQSVTVLEEVREHFNDEVRVVVLSDTKRCQQTAELGGAK